MRRALPNLQTISAIRTVVRTRHHSAARGFSKQHLIGGQIPDKSADTMRLTRRRIALIRHHSMSSTTGGACHHVRDDIGLPDADLPQVPPDNVNRRAKVARRLRLLQHNITLDSKIDEKESVHRLKPCHFCAAWTHLDKKSAPLRDALEKLSKTRKRVQNQLRAFTREDKRDIFRDAVFLCMTPFVTPRISSGCAAFKAAAAAA
ncbi:hypothetical protein SAMN05444714_2106 [Yoonia litorea]|uniref:Uncharacterized protein n=1 Tax=Yoonia litorea TaxID=1123755 RepID=A0A1I6MU16_9RHOB|nr:hypothetical protein SAMN05444714_2106 [Yoonia litorea]